MEPRTVGFWRQRREDRSELPHPADLVDDSWPVVERVRVATYLRNGAVACAYLGYSFCRLECGVPIDALGTRDLTDGEWVWPEGFAHYVEHHAVKPPAEFLAAIAPRLPRAMPWWRVGHGVRSFVLARRIEAARREAEADKLLPPHTTALHDAAQSGDVAAIEQALESYAVDAKNRLEETALLVAARAGRVDAVRLLLAHGATVDARTGSHITPLAEARGAATMELLLDAGAAIEPEPPGHSTPLTTACMQDDLAGVTLLLDRGASPNRGDRFRTPLEASGSLAVVQLLLARGADAKIGHPLVGAAKDGDIPRVRLLLEAGADPDARDTREQTALYKAAASKLGDDVVDILLEAGADPAVRDDLRDTPLHMACARSSVRTVARLLEAGVPIRTKSKRGMTPLHWAALAPERRDDAPEVVEKLLSAGADTLDARDEWGRTPLAIAESRGDERTAAALRRGGARQHER